MTRFLNFVLLFMLGTIFYIQTDGLGSNKVEASIQPAQTKQTVTEIETETTAPKTVALVTPTVETTVEKAADPQPEPEPVQEEVFKVEATPAPTPKTNALTQTQIDEIEGRFAAQRLTASTVIRTAAITTAAEPETTPTSDVAVQEFFVNGSVVNARSEPNTSSEILAKLRRGTAVVSTGNTDGAWAEVIVVETGQFVWMHTDFLSRS